MEWAKSFIGDDLPDGPDEDYYTGLKFSWYWFQGDQEFFMDLYREYGPVFTVRLMGLKVIAIVGAEANQYMYVDNWRDFYWWGESIQGHLAGLIGEGLLASVDDKHDKARRLLDPVFSKENLKTYVKEMIERTESEVQDLSDGETFDFYEWAYDMALINASACFMGMETDRRKTRILHEHFDTCAKFYQKPIHLQTLRGPGTPHWYFQQSKDKIDELLYDEIEDRQGNRGSDRGNNILDRLIEAEEGGETFTREEIHDQILNLYWAGHDTTISAVSWLVLMVGMFHNSYEKLKTEVDERVGDEPIVVDEVIDGLPYLEMVMDETLRMFPPAWIAFRKSRSDFEIYGEEIPADTELAFSSFLTHRLPHLYEKPESFIPERMTPGRKRERPPGSFIPFARGPRTCIGMNFARYEIKVIVASLLRQFDFELLSGNNLDGYPVATLTPASVRIRLKRRNGNESQFQPAALSDLDRDTFSGDSESDGCPVH